MSREERYRVTGEVFTPPSLTKKILSSLPKEVWKENKTFLDPACGNGNLLIPVLWRKIENGHKPLEALQSVYGVDIMPDNVRECRIRLLLLVSLFETVTGDHIKAVLTNIVFVKKGSLEYDFSFAPETNIDDWLDWRNPLKEKELPVTEALFAYEDAKERNIFL